MFPHELVREVGINFPHMPFEAVAHPNAYNVRADVLLTYGGERMRKEYCVAFSSFIIRLKTRFMLFVSLGFTTESKFIFPCIIFDTGIFLGELSN